MYEIYVSEEEGSLGTKIHEVTDRSTTVFYFEGRARVRVFDDGGLSSYSNQVAVRTEARVNMFPLFGGLVLLAAAVVAVIVASKKGLLGLPKGS